MLTWEAAFRTFRWKAFLFPAPSHILESFLGWLNVTGQHDVSAFVRAFVTGIAAAAGLLLGSEDIRERVATILSSPLLTGVAVSLLRLLIGFVASAVVGVALGLTMWRWQAVDKFLGPLFLGLQTLPSVCWAPLAIMFFGFSEKGILFVMVMGSAFAVALAFRDGLRTIPPIYQRAGMMLGARGWRLYYHVLLPASLPVFATSLRQGFSFAWRSLMGGEFVLLAVRPEGLGVLLDKGRTIGGVEDVLAIMIVMIGIGMLADRLGFARIEAAIHRRFGLEAAR